MATGRRVDSNHREIVKKLRQAGVRVFDTSALGGGFPDILCGVRGRFVLLEIKATEKSKLTDLEKKFFFDYDEYPVYVVTSFDDALEKLGLSWRL